MGFRGTASHPPSPGLSRVDPIIVERAFNLLRTPIVKSGTIGQRAEVSLRQEMGGAPQARDGLPHLRAVAVASS